MIIFLQHDAPRGDTIVPSVLHYGNDSNSIFAGDVCEVRKPTSTPFPPQEGCSDGTRGRTINAQV